MKKTLLFLLVALFATMNCTTVAQKPFKMNIDGSSITLTLADIKKFWEPEMAKNMTDLNRQCPMSMADGVSMTYVGFKNNTVYVDLKINVSASSLSASDKKEIKDATGPALMEGLKEGLLQVDTNVMPRSEWLRLFRELNIKFHIRMLDRSGAIICTLDADTSSLR